MHPRFAAKEMAETVLEREPEKYLENKMQKTLQLELSSLMRI